MKNFSRFLIRKLKNFVGCMFVSLIGFVLSLSICISLILFASIPGVLMALFVSGLDPQALFIGGLKSSLTIFLLCISFYKAEGLIQECKSFNDEK